MSKEELLKYLIAEIDLIMHDKDYRFENANGTWYSRESCRDLTNEEMFEELRTELRQFADLEARLAESEHRNEQLVDALNGKVFINYKLPMENAQLKQQLHDLPKKIVGEIRDVAGDYWEECGNVTDLYTLTMEDFDEILDAILEKFGDKNESNND